MNLRKGNGLDLTGKGGMQIVMIMMIYYDFICTNFKNHNDLRSIILCK